MLSTFRRTVRLSLVALCVLASSMFAPTPSARSLPVPPTPTAALAPAVPGDEFWDDQFDGHLGQSQATSYNSVFATTIFRDELYVGGDFVLINGRPISGVARWDGRQWQAVGEGTRGTISGMAIYNGSLYVVGRFQITIADENVITNIARWDGTEWHRVGAILDNPRLHFKITGARDGVYVVGEFDHFADISAEGIARWDGTAWHPVGTGELEDDPDGHAQINSVISTPDGIYAGGEFTSIGGVPARNIAFWNGRTWSAVGSGLNNWVDALAFDGDDIYAGGYFTQTGTLAVHNLARWNGQTWADVGGGVSGTYSWVHSIVVNNSQVYIGGSFSEVGAGIAAQNIASWNGTEWTTYLPTANNLIPRRVYNVSFFDNQLYLGGSGFNHFDPYFVRWNNGRWQEVGGQVAFDRVTSIVATPDNFVYVTSSYGGATTTYGEPMILPRWNGHAWDDAGIGLQLPSVVIYALVANGSEVYASGSYTQNNVTRGFVAKRSGSTWTIIEDQFNNYVTELAYANGTLYVAGGFTTVNTVPITGIAKWDGATWSGLGSGISDGTINVLAARGNDLYVGGWFDYAGGIEVNKIAHWDGTTWSGLDGGVYTTAGVNAIAIDTDGTVYVGGSLLPISCASPLCRNLARWRNGVWETVGGGINEYSYDVVTALAFGPDGLYVAGRFSDVGVDSIPAKSIARYNGQWHSLGSGLRRENVMNGGDNAWPLALASNGRNVYVGGEFGQAGQFGSVNFAVWHNPIGPNAQPVATADTATTFRARSVEVAVLANDWDMDNDALTITTITQPANGTATVIAGTHIRYTPPTDFVGTATVNYTLSDNHGGSATSTLTITVAPREYVFLPAVQR